MDSSGWIELFTDGPLARRFETYSDSDEPMVVPTVVVYEVYKVIRRERSQPDALLAAAKLKSHLVVPLDDSLAMEAADLSLQHRLAMADAIVYATAQAHQATLVTGDAHFAGLPGVKHISMQGRASAGG